MSRAASACAFNGPAGRPGAGPVSRWGRIGLLVTIIVAAGLFRLRGLDFGLPALLLTDAMGIGGLALALAGFVVGIRRRPAFVILSAAALAFILSLCLQHLIWERWVIPILPLLAIAAAVAAVRLVDAVLARGRAAALGVGAVASLVLLVPPLMLADTHSAERTVDTRRLATAWARTHVPPDSTVAVEYFAFDTLASRWRLLFPTGEKGCIDARDLLGRRVTVSKVGSLRGSRPIIDMGSVGAEAAATCRADIMILANYDRYLAEAERFPKEIADYRRLIGAGRFIAVFRPVPGRVGGPIVRVYRFAR